MKRVASRVIAMRRFLIYLQELAKELDVPVSIETPIPSLEETYHGYSDTLETEMLIHTLPKDQLEVLICLHLGIKPTEIVKVLHYPNIIRYYNVSSKLRSLYLQRKSDSIAYN
jgi:hypothetical protein